MITPLDPEPKASSSKQFTVRLVALKQPIGENGPVASVSVLVKFDQELPAHGIETNAKVFEAAENVLRDVRGWDRAQYKIREAALCQAVSENADADREPDGKWDGARVWLTDRW